MMTPAIGPSVIAIDLDGTLIREAGGKILPLPGAVDAMRQLRSQGHRIVIHSCRTGLAGECLDLEVQQITAILNEFGIEYDEIFIGEKLVADAYIDDRAVPFRGDWEDAKAGLAELLQTRSGRR